MSSLRHLFIISLTSIVLTGALSATKPTGQSVVFIHPDGAGLPAWNIYRIWKYGPDGNCYWDTLPGIAVYRSHMKDNLNASSHGGGTTHAYGVKVLRDSYGLDGQETIRSASGFEGSLMQEAMAAGMNVGIINSGHMAEPGTATMLASVSARRMREEIALQLVESGAPLIMGGGEVLFLPQDKTGVHGKMGLRNDGRDLVEEAEEAGYTVIYTLDELMALPLDTPKVLGLFAAENTYNHFPEEVLALTNRPAYLPEAPTVTQMADVALEWMQAQGKPFFLMLEEEGTDNFPNALNAYGMLEAMDRADNSIYITLEHMKENPDLSLIVAADSEASGPELIAVGIYSKDSNDHQKALPPQLKSGAPLDGIRGANTPPFVSAADQFGQRHLFGIAWTDGSDKFGGVLVRAAGPIAKDLPANMDNTAIFTQIRQTILEDD